MRATEEERIAEGVELNLRHICEVNETINIFADALFRRGVNHDASKLEEPERRAFALGALTLRDTTYGSEEYKAALEDAKFTDALAHHYASNHHHPEYFTCGIEGMNLIDLIEMMADWIAAVNRHADGDIRKSLAINAKRFKISPQLLEILHNTVEAFESNTL